ncbi:TonB-dependent receptor [Epilithonimonas vandammei]|uniref:TonB-dependent receptor n=1 Tax=Epilithonimonas vandammei TaxID=2487072 RepID=UPI0028B0903E|nr:TonB-dependent receptor plug domain-containing protein [Epilithonimonas vandammei]
MKMLSKKPAFALMLTMTTASFYFAQSTQDTLSKDNEIEQVVLTGVADIAKDRKTPVAVSTIKEAQIIEKLGNQEFPEILNSTPSVYATKGGGGFGDSNLVIRGFDQRNIAIMVNGVPVNDMESGAVYWSNWAGLSDVTSAMQVQRGLGSSKLAIASVGGTVNILTRAADKKEGGIVSIGVGNDDYHKSLFAYNTGKNEKGWSSSFLMSRTAGRTYIDNTQFEGYNYYFALGYQPSAKHDLQFTITGAPQTHNQRTYAPTIANYIKFNPDQDGTPNRKYNSDWGYLNGEAFPMRVNYYHKPVMSINWDWKISENSKLNTVGYGSFGRGGGTGDLGKVGGKTLSQWGVDSNGQMNLDQVYAANALVNPVTAAAGSTLVRRSSINSHNWFGLISSFNQKVNENFNFTAGIDTRYYYGYHYQLVSDLLGARGYKDDKNKNIAPNVVSNVYAPNPTWNPFGGKTDPMEDRVGYSNDGEVLWYGAFGQAEYSTEKLSAFIQGAVSNQAFQRIDAFVKDGVTVQRNQTVNTKTGFKDIVGYNIKGGVNYNFDDHNNAFANIGYYSKQPFLNSVYPSNFQVVNPNLTNEKIFSAELGYGYRSPIFSANVNIYRTTWGDRWQRKTVNFNASAGTSTTTGYVEMSGIEEVHQGAEVDFVVKPFKFLEFTGMFSYGDYHYNGNASGSLFDDNNNPVSFNNSTSNSSELYLNKAKVGNAPQTTAALGFNIKPVKDLSFDTQWRYVDRNYANIDVNTFTDATVAAKGTLELPSFNLFDLGLSYKIRLNNDKQYFTIRGNVYNLFDTTYIQESATNNHVKQVSDFKTSSNTDTQAQALYNTYINNPNNFYKGLDVSNRVYFGFGRTWAATLSFNF